MQAILLLGFAVIVSGCHEEKFKEPITNFQKNAETAATAISSYYTELNQLERDLYFQDQLLNPHWQVLLTDSAGKPTALLSDPFDPHSIQARIALIRQIAAYVEKLSDLAGDAAPGRLKTNATELTTSLMKLGGRFNDLGNRSDSADKEAKDYVGPISAIVGVIGQVIIEEEREKALKPAIRKGEKPITEILSFLERDLKKYVESTRRTGHKQKLAQLVSAYNNNAARDTLPLAQRKMMLDDIRLAAEEVRIISVSQPADVIRAMREVHQELVKAAHAPTSTNLGAVRSALEAYEDQVKQLVDTVIKLRELRKGETP
jgi:hypothetical protein